MHLICSNKSTMQLILIAKSNSSQACAALNVTSTATLLEDMGLHTQDKRGDGSSTTLCCMTCM